jgi:hypothetical protein
MGAEAEPKGRRFGIFPALLLLAATGAFGAWYFESDSATPVIPTGTTSTQKQIEKPAARVAGIYEITRTNRVYAEPSEFSPQLIGDIETGMKVSVVNSHDGWLEIHSKHGRPPGFIRRDVVARIASQD